MAYLVNRGEFEAEIKRGAFSHRSRRLDALVGAIDTYIGAPSSPHLERVRDALDEWQGTDPKEFSDRGQLCEPRLRKEIADHSVMRPIGRSRIRVVDASSHPRYEPQKWNDGGAIQFSTNCYAYACDDPFGHEQGGKPQPGQLAGVHARRASDVADDRVRYAVLQDDRVRHEYRKQRLIPLVRLRGDEVPDRVANAPGYYLIALVTCLGVDYHWLRQDRDGLWSHKPGFTEVTNRDYDGQVIKDPRDANLRVPDPQNPRLWKPYEFTTFYYAPKGGVRTGQLGEPAG